ncbi:VOC family protein [Nonomuraea sp. ZG12]|uniref:VOC family protein n=1 Tax=Nonomuraea sp. ZG12 TaxID=3452207 RepID=UPI003F88A35A
MTFSLTSLIVDAADLESESSFWHRLLGGSITRTATHHFLRIDGFPVIVIQHAPGHVPPQWPDGVSQQMHVDLATDDAATAAQRVLDAGGRRLRPADDDVVASTRPGSRVYASPAGHPFCVSSA